MIRRSVEQLRKRRFNMLLLALLFTASAAGVSNMTGSGQEGRVPVDSTPQMRPADDPTWREGMTATDILATTRPSVVATPSK